MIGDFAKENEKFVNEKKVVQRREDSALPPWVGYHEEDILKEQILELSQVGAALQPRRLFVSELCSNQRVFGLIFRTAETFSEVRHQASISTLISPSLIQWLW